jgi:hypothetical protein
MVNDQTLVWPNTVESENKVKLYRLQLNWWSFKNIWCDN